MKTIYALLISTLLAHAGWYGLDFSPAYAIFDATPSGSELADFNFPPQSLHAHFPAFLLHEQAAPFDLRGTTITCTFDLTNVTPETLFVFGGISSFNKGPTPPHARLFFSTVSGYYNEGVATNYWFHNNGSYAVITNNMGVATLTATIDHWGDWTDNKGGSLSNAFWDAAGRAVQVGMCFGGGYYFDVGIAVSAGNATFRLLSFTVKPSYRLKIERETAQVSVADGFEANSYQIEESDDLVSWCSAGVISGTNAITAMPNHFYRATLVE
jgi:hypothetical protein